MYGVIKDAVAKKLARQHVFCHVWLIELTGAMHDSLSWQPFGASFGRMWFVLLFDAYCKKRFASKGNRKFKTISFSMVMSIVPSCSRKNFSISKRK